MLFFTYLLMSYILFILISIFIWICYIHDKSSDKFNNKKLKDILLTSVGKIFSFLPMSQLIWLLTVIEREEMMHLFLVVYHYYIYFFILHLVLRLKQYLLCPCRRLSTKKSDRRM